MPEYNVANMTRQSEVIGDINPREIIQIDTKACLSACILGLLDPSLGLEEHNVTAVLVDDGVHSDRQGSKLLPAAALSRTLDKLGLSATPVYDARFASPHDDDRVAERLLDIDVALRSGRGTKVLIAYPKRRPEQEPLPHFSTVHGFELVDGETFITISDPSDYVNPEGKADGGVKSLHWTEFLEYLTPTDNVPVMAWGITPSEKLPGTTHHYMEEPDLPGLSLLDNPLSSYEQTGWSVPPDTNHPTTTVIPTTEITKSFKNLGDVVLSHEGKEPAGYPRFVVPENVKRLSLSVTESPNNLPFPTRLAAEAAAHMSRTYSEDGSGANVLEAGGLFWLEGNSFNLDAWQHTGLGISSRQALANLEAAPENNLAALLEAEHVIKTAIIAETGAKHEDIYLFPTGMAGIFTLNQALIKIYGDAPAVQFGFPYVDTFEQRKFGPHKSISQNVIDLRDADYEKLEEMIKSGQQIRLVATEYPSNPLLYTPDFERLDKILQGKVPVVLDATVGTTHNLDIKKLPKSVVALPLSLTKYFSSVGDVMGGAVILRPESPHYHALKAALNEIYEDNLWYEDAQVLAKNSRYYPEIMPVVNKNGQDIASWLDKSFVAGDGPLEAVYHPSLTGTKAYDAVKKAGGGYGGLMSLKFKNPEQGYAFFDALDVTKAPGLGMYYTTACLYTILGHKPATSVAKFGVAPDLVRISFGIEDGAELRRRIVRALRLSR